MGISFRKLFLCLGLLASAGIWASEASLRRDVVDLSFHQLGKSYRWDRNGPDEFDCSGFVHYVLKNALGVQRFGLPYSLKEIAGYTRQSLYYRDYLRANRARIDCESAKAADVIFFLPKNSGENNHIGIVVDPRRATFVTAQSKELGVQEHPYGRGTYWADRAPECYRNIWVY